MTKNKVRFFITPAEAVVRSHLATYWSVIPDKRKKSLLKELEEHKKNRIYVGN